MGDLVSSAVAAQALPAPPQPAAGTGPAKDEARSEAAASPGRGLAPLRHRGLVAALAATALTYLVVLELVADSYRGAVATAALSLGQAACGVALLLPRRSETAPLRRVWRLAGAAMLSSSGIFAVWAYFAIRHGEQAPLPSLADAFFVVTVTLLLAAALGWPVIGRRGRERWRYLLDGAVVIVSLLLISWVQVIGPSTSGVTSAALSLPVVLPLVYPVLDLVGLAAALYAVTSAAPGTRRPAAYLAATLAAFALGDGLFAVQSAAGDWNYGTATMALWLIAPVLLVAGRFSSTRDVPPALRDLAVAGATRTSALLPLLPVAAALLVAITHPGTGATVIGTALVALLMVRYGAAGLTDRKLVRDLEGDALTDAAFLEATLQHLSEPVLAVDADGRVRFFNDAFKALRPHIAVGAFAGPAGPDDVFRDERGVPIAPSDLPLLRALAGEDVAGMTLVMREPSGEERILRASARPIRTPADVGTGSVSGAVLVTQDVTDARHAQSRLIEQATTDDLTGLGNRAQFNARLAAAAATDDPARTAVLLLDVDDFKNVNDSLGHVAGDELLIAVGRRIRTVLRAEDCAARLGGDEFVLLLRHADQDRAVTVAERLLACLDAPVALGDVEVSVSASVGVAMCDVATDAHTVLGAADLAMYLAKQRGKGAVAVFEPHMQHTAQARLSLENDLRRAVRNDELHLVYQPIVDLVTGALAGVEALVRWQDPVRGFVSPGDFIPVAEETGLILPLGEWVLREAVGQLARWNQAFPQTSLVLSVNVSTRQLERQGLLTAVDGLVADGLNPAQLVIEITETALGLNDDATRQTLRELRDRGVHLAVDDFGTGYSSLGRLRAAPVSRLKIDRSFVSEIVHGGSDVPIVDATMAMARGLGLGVVAEGIETQAQLDYLRRLGCPQAQGYLLARPLAPSAVADILAGDVPWAALVRPDSVMAADPSPGLGRLLDLAVAGDVDVEQLVRPLLDDLARLTGLTTTYLTRLTDDGQQRVEYTSTGTSAVKIVEGTAVAWADSLCRRALDEGIPRTEDAEATFPDTHVARDLGIRSYLAEPLRDSQGHLYGTLCGASASAVTLTDADSATARLFARLLADKLRGATSTDATAAQAPADEPQSAADEAAEPAGAAAILLEQRRAQAWEMWHAAQPVHAAPGSPVEAAEAGGVEKTRVLRQRAHDVLVQRTREIVAAGAATTDAAHGRVMIADDDDVIRAIVAMLVAAEPALQVVAQAHTGAATIGIAIAEQPDLLILDYDLGDTSAFEVIPELRQFSPGTRILLHSGRDDVHQIAQRLGVDRAVWKGDGSQRLRDALQSLTLGLTAGGARDQEASANGSGGGLLIGDSGVR